MTSMRRRALGLTILVTSSLLLSLPAHAHEPSDAERHRAHIAERARTQIGASYSYGGVSPRAFDCSGLTRWVYSGHGADLPHSSQEQFELGARDRYKRIWKRSELKVGDLVFHKTTGARVGHVGIYLGKGRFISTTSSSGVAVRSLYDPYYWGSRWVGATRLPAMITSRDDASDGRASIRPGLPSSILS
ncbi:MAG: C40 family peptidase [Actinomycetota bacterium]